MKTNNINLLNFKSIARIKAPIATARTIASSINSGDSRLRQIVCNGEKGEVYAFDSFQKDESDSYIVSGKQARQIKENYLKILEECKKALKEHIPGEEYSKIVDLLLEKHSEFAQNIVKTSPVSREIKAKLANDKVKILDVKS